jgi:hypothetical protein
MTYDAAFNALRSEARKRHIRLRCLRPDGDGEHALAAWSSARRTIIVSKSKRKNSRAVVLYALAHELGHAIDFDSMDERQQHEFNDVVSQWLIFRFVELGTSREISDVMLEHEKIAFDNADDLVERLGLGLNRDVTRAIRKAAMRVYKNELY